MNIPIAINDFLDSVHFSKILFEPEVHLERAQIQLKNRPREKFSYLTPNEYFFSIFTSTKDAFAA